MAQDAITLLDADHQRVEALFKDYQSAGADQAQKHDLAQIICMELTVHAQLEEELFYPAVRQATGDQDMVKEAEQEHQEARQLIAKIQQTQNADALVQQLQKAIEHHVLEERQEMFPKARQAGLDLGQLGRQLESRKAELVSSIQAA